VIDEILRKELIGNRQIAPVDHLVEHSLDDRLDAGHFRSPRSRLSSHRPFAARCASDLSTRNDELR
jgi:hypothetical protein